MNVARDVTCGERSKFIRVHPSGRGAARGGCPGGGGQAARGYKRGRPWPRLAHSRLSPLSGGVGSLPAAELRLRLQHSPARIAAALSLSHSSCAFRRPHYRPNWNFLRFLVNFAVRCRCSAPRDWADWRSAVAVLVGVWVCGCRGEEGFFVGCRVIGNLIIGWRCLGEGVEELVLQWSLEVGGLWRAGALDCTCCARARRSCSRHRSPLLEYYTSMQRGPTWCINTWFLWGWLRVQWNTISAWGLFSGARELGTSRRSLDVGSWLALIALNR